MGTTYAGLNAIDEPTARLRLRLSAIDELTARFRLSAIDEPIKLLRLPVSAIDEPTAVTTLTIVCGGPAEARVGYNCFFNRAGTVSPAS